MSDAFGKNLVVWIALRLIKVLPAGQAGNGPQGMSPPSHPAPLLSMSGIRIHVVFHLQRSWELVRSPARGIRYGTAQNLRCLPVQRAPPVHLLRRLRPSPISFEAIPSPFDSGPALHKSEHYPRG